MNNKRAKATKSTYGVAVFVFCLFVICRIVTPAGLGVLSKEQLVASYQATAQNSLFERDRWIVEVREQTTIEGAVSKTAPRGYVRKYTVYRDRDRLDYRRERMALNEENERIDKKRFQCLISGGRSYSYGRWVREADQLKRVIVSNDTTRRLLYSAGSNAKALEGYMDNKPLAKILAEESSVLHMRPSMEMANGFLTYVLEATTPYGHYTVWMDPNCGYSPRRVIIERGPKDLFDGKPVSTPLPPSPPGLPRGTPHIPLAPLEHVRFVLEIEKIKEIGSSFFATEGTTTTTEVYSDGSIMEFHAVCERTLIDLNPDFNDIPDAFVLDVPNGTRVFDQDFPGIHYVWQDGKVTTDIDEYVIEQIDKVAEEILAEGKVPPCPETVRKPEAAPNEPASPSDTQPKTKVDTVKTQPEAVAESGSSTIVLVILIVLLIIGVIGWLVFR